MRTNARPSAPRETNAAPALRRLIRIHGRRKARPARRRKLRRQSTDAVLANSGRSALGRGWILLTFATCSGAQAHSHAQEKLEHGAQEGPIPHNLWATARPGVHCQRRAYERRVAWPSCIRGRRLGIVGATAYTYLIGREMAKLDSETSARDAALGIPRREHEIVRAPALRREQIAQ